MKLNFRAMQHSLALLTALLLAPLAALHAAEPTTINKLHKPSLLPANWDPALAGDGVMDRLIKVSAPQVKGAHDAEFVCLGDRAYIVEHDNDIQPGHGAGKAEYCVLSVVNLKTLKVEKVIPMAKSGEAFENETLLVGACFVPRIIRASETTLRCYFTSEDGNQREAQMWYRDFDLRTMRFEGRIHKVKLKTAAGVFDMQPQHFHADAAAQRFTKPAQRFGLYIFDSFKEFDGRRYVAINNFPGKQNALALVHDDLATFEVIGHYNEPQSQQLSESAVNRLPDGTWIAICRNDGGNYHFTTSKDGRTWSVGEPMPFVPNGLNSKPTFDKFGGVYYLGWQENTKVQDCGRSVFNVDISRDGRAWERKYRFETPESFQYPTFHEHEGTIWLTVTQSDHNGSTDRIMFGKLEDVGRFESQSGKTRKPLPTPTEEPAVMKMGAALFTDRDYVIQEMPKQVRSLPFLRTSIEKIDVEVTKAGALYAMTPTVRPKAASQEEALKQAGFTKVEVPEVQLFPGEINRVSLYRKDVKSGERLSFKKMVLLIFDKGTEVKVVGAPATPAADDMPASVRPDLKWSAQATEDAKQDFTSIPYDGITPNKLVCDTTLRELPDGSWALFMLAGDDFEPSPKNYTGLTRSFDKGRTWTPLQAVDIGLPREGKTMGQGPTELMTIGNRSMLFFSTHSQTWGRDWQSWFIHSDDNCKTWSQPQPVPGRLARFTFIRNHIVTRDGRILLPFQHYEGPPAGTPPPPPEEKPWHKTLFHYVSNPRNGVLISSDGGKTWTEHGNIRLTPDDRYHGWAENNIAELGDGRIAMIIRADRLGGVLYYAESKDGGKTWPEFAVKSDIPNPGSKATLYPLGGDTVALLHNPNPKARHPLALWISFDGMKTWPYQRVLVEHSSDGPGRAMNYPDGFISKDKQWLHFAYDDNRHRAVHYSAKLPPLP